MEKKLTIKELAAYLPYGVKLEYEGILNGKEISDYKKLTPKFNINNSDDYFYYMRNLPLEIVGKKISEIKAIKFFKKYTTIHLGTYHGHLKTCSFHNIKPILYSLDYLTKQITYNGETFIPLEKLTQIFGGRPIKFDGNCFYIAIQKSSVRRKEDVVPLHFSQLDAFNKMFEWKIDMFNLIDSGLAIAVTESFNPYK
jgi:hypothetical protein